MRIVMLTGPIALILLAGVAGANETLGEIGRQCGLQLNLSERGCNCIVDRASDELNETQRRMLLARVTRDPAAERAISLSQPEMQEVMAFIQSAPRTCAP